MARDAGKLIICPTPLGNLGDMPPRALDALRSADAVCCEDTRVTGRLLAALDAGGKRLERLDEEVLGKKVDAILARVRAGERIAYCSDAGMPGVSDPGARLVAAARSADLPVEVLPGPTAAATAYVASGFACPRFYFGGFFPRKAAERAKALDLVAGLDAVCIFYESPKRLPSCLEAVAARVPERCVCVCRELTKLHEEVVLDTARQLAREFTERESAGGVKGEIVLVIDAAGEAESAAAEASARSAASERAAALHAEGALSKKDIMASLQAEFGISRNDAYRLAHGS